MSEQFDFEKALAALQNGQDLTGKDGILNPLIKQLTETAFKAELESHIETAEGSNRKNGSSKKTIKSPSGSFDPDTLRDRTGSFEPQLIKKYQTHLIDEIERKILSMFGLGMSYQDIASHVAELNPSRIGFPEEGCVILVPWQGLLLHICPPGMGEMQKIEGTIPAFACDTCASMHGAR